VLPILTFDENKLRPSYGYFFDRSWLAPDESIVAIAWKFAKMNVLPGHVVAQHLSVRPTDPYEGFAPILSNIDVHTLARTFAIPRRALCVSIESPGFSRRMSDRLRYCSRCMGLSYHGVMHQHAGATRCPCHRTPLEEACLSGPLPLGRVTRKQLFLNHAINQNTTIKSSKKSKRKLAAWSTTRLQELLGLQAYPQASKAADS
jgi:hypothetical protein